MDQLSPAAPGLAIGLRRSYGDSGLNPGGRVIDMTGLDRLIAFDRSTGVMRGEAGVSLSQCLRALVPAGWFLPTTPGASFVTLGGAVANDVHGKNHFSAGSFGNAVRRLGLRRTDGAVHDLQPGDPLFTATIGGLGLTGVIEWVEFQAVRIPSSWLDAEDVAFRNLDEFFDLSDERKDTAEHAMAWVDGLAIGASLGRGVYSFANWSSANRSRQEKSAPERERPRKKMPMDAPGFLLNSFSVKAFNEIYNGLKTMQAGKRLTHHEPFLYPLDAISDWNRLYGARGFYQYQSVVPTVTAREAVRDQLKLIARSRQGSFLAVLKNMGPILSVGTLSFPMSGTTLAMDFPNRGKRTLQLMSDLDRIVMEAGGRLYPAKDGRMSASMFQAGFPQWKDFRAQVDPGLSSGFWRRVSA
ncbi:MAG: FAD-binding oxidoreductase [Alphaproteobacteria bacterium]|nr:FAD-binding oxidoreductase [Alphaproteobacteria bacterium]